jgi:hypothetical protein
MRKVIAASVVMLLVSTSAFGAVGDISQAFQHNILLGGIVNWSLGEGGGGFNLNMTLHNDQTADGILNSHAYQATDITLTTEAGGGGDGATIVVRGATPLTQHGVGSFSKDGGAPFGAPSFAGQVQLVSVNLGNITQAQGVRFDGGQGLFRNDGPGGAHGENTIESTLYQEGANNAGSVNETSTISADQDSHVGGGAAGNGSVVTTSAAETEQIQSLN